MTARRRTARAFLLGAGGSTAAGLHVATTHPALALLFLYPIGFCVWSAWGYYRAHHRQLAEADWERRHVLGWTPGPLNPCCMLAHHSGGEAHDGKCTDLVHRPTANPRSTT
ncbi:hypothetical protein [Streptomyces sp. NPDC096142]|uniref:hypothetical protein n=1 Tax=Streptomyces sp. NPDC096142 TaxID=3366077 RepID=UPI0037F2D814